MIINYVLIDYENVQPKEMAILDQKHFRIIVFVGASQTNIKLEVASALQPMGAQAEYVRIAGNGPNALDFHIAFYIGHLAAQEPDAYFHIISKDTGFDPLIQHLKSKKIRVCRSSDITDIHILKAATATSAAERLAVVIADLQKRGTARPRTIKTLSSTINALFQKKLSEQDLALLIQALQKQGFISIDDKKVSYTPYAEFAESIAR